MRAGVRGVRAQGARGTRALACEGRCEGCKGH